jgi:hypothetical protein
MANTTFSGPVRAGNIIDTTGVTLGTNVKNIGPVVLTQSATVALTHVNYISYCSWNRNSSEQSDT